MNSDKDKIVNFLENRIKYEKELRDWSTDEESYSKSTTVIETIEELLKEIKTF